MSLTINGKKNKITKTDFDILAKNLSLNEKQRDNSYEKFIATKEKIEWWVQNSFLPNNQKNKLQNLVDTRIEMFDR
ncbi:MAG: hypothetical protein PHW82_05310 [Bacteroidales bacterium]|nr:hypothetical protein [Bacteroidales bacterium]